MILTQLEYLYHQLSMKHNHNFTINKNHNIKAKERDEFIINLLHLTESQLHQLIDS